jgi:transglutaminase-like putative cysteine protease
VSAAAAVAAPREAPRVVAPRVLVRLVAVGALAAFGAQAWGDMVRPGADGRLLAAAAVGIALAAVLAASARLPRAARIAVGAVGMPVGVGAFSLLLAGVPLHLLDLESWGDLANGLGQGIQALPGLNVPYRGVDEWNRIAMLLGGTLLATGGTVLAIRRPLAGIVLLAALYAVPAVQLDAGSPWLEGLAFALLLGAALWAERMAPREAPLGFVVVLVAGLVALALAPRLDAREPWVDYESLAQSLGDKGTSSFSWEHSYGPLDWPRDGREVLRIKAENAAYWKATTLTEFDGRRWVDSYPQGIEDDPEADSPRERWVQDLQVSVRNLRTRQFISAGTTLEIDKAPRDATRAAPGSFVISGRPLRRGHSYVARAYVPRPRQLEIEAAGTAYPTALWPYLQMGLPEAVGGPPPIDAATQAYDPNGRPAFVVFSPFGDQRPALGFIAGRGFGERVGTEWVRDSAYARMYGLARRLREEAETPYAYVRAVQRHLQQGFTYTESPPERSVPLDAFVFVDKTGYCQQFSGAMALLLRMGGVPARVASGFSPGTFDEERREFVVRDLDAHSWVEAYFPGYGWIPFDPTPAVAPARAQLPSLSDDAEEAGAEESEGGVTRGSERAQDPRALGQDAANGDSGPPVALLVLGVAAVVLLLLALVYLLLARRWRARYGPEVAARELARALRRTGRALRPGATLSAVEESFRWSPDAAAYVRAVRTSRYGYDAAAPTREQRRALRRELASGLGLRGRLRALWALPPF